MSPLSGRAVLVVSAAGYPLTEAVIRRFGRSGATSDDRQLGAPGRQAVRRGAVATLSTLHTVRFGIYLRPDHGLRAAPRHLSASRPDVEAATPPGTP